ncbi:hypothetical protein TNCV_2535541 [Trichonephila clavipes]|nr:hypothetical protein TNCV_2535541 [Trichonephila clavipes]
MSAMETDQKDRVSDSVVDFCDFITRTNLRRKQPEPKRIAVEPPPIETDTDKCHRHQEMQKRIKMANGRLSYLEHCIRSEKEFPDLTDADALVKFQKEHDELSSQKETKFGDDQPSQGFNVEKVNSLSLTRSKIQSPAPHFLHGRARKENQLLQTFLTPHVVAARGGRRVQQINDWGFTVLQL